jgi:hypothetical protein
MVHWAETIGPNTARLFERIMNDKRTRRWGNRGCLGIIRLAEKYPAQRVEAACERVLLSGACRYKSVESILRNSLDQAPPTSRKSWRSAGRHYPWTLSLIRGPGVWVWSGASPRGTVL